MRLGAQRAKYRCCVKEYEPVLKYQLVYLLLGQKHTLSLKDPDIET
jgi:hypothetical protein